jgi:hypothetical protein
MSDDPNNPDILFSSGDWVIDRNNPGQPGQYTGRWSKAGSFLMLQLAYPGGGSRASFGHGRLLFLRGDA